MRTAAAVVCGALAAAALWWGLRETFAATLFGRVNVRGRTVPVGAGIVIALAVLAVTALDRTIVALGADRLPLGTDPTTLLAVVGFGLLGLFDDLAAVGDDRGFRGHLGAMARGRLTTGGLKLVGGGLLAAVLVAPVEADRPLQFAADVALVALAANLANLLDRAPGRCAKVALLAGAGVLATGLPAAVGGVAVVLGAAAALLVSDLREQLMLGDAGANALGGALGLAVVHGTSPTTRLAVLAVVLALNLASEAVSFSRVIDRTPPLRWLDHLGRSR